MKQYFTRRLPLSTLIMVLLACHPMMMAQSLAFAHQNKPSNIEARETAPSSTTRLKDALNELSQQHQVSIIFEDVTVRGLLANSSVTKGGKLEIRLDKLLKPHGLTFQKVNKNAYVVVPLSAPKKPEKPSQENSRTSDNNVPALSNNLQEKGNLHSNTIEVNDLLVAEEIPVKVITGTVTDETGERLPGTNVLVKGTTVGAITDVNGEFSLDVPDENSILVFSFTGFLTQEVVVGNQTNIAIILKQDDLLLNEVVVVGYGEIKKSDLTGAVASVQTKDIVRGNPIIAAKAIQGQVAGATVTKLNNKPGTGYSITIRGENTINNSTEPLVVIDGLMGGNINNLNPNDIQSMDILKDASSTAIYGSRGANGVIIITTKKGVSGKPRISYDSYIGVKNPAHLPELMNTAQFYKSLYTDRVLEGATGASFTAAERANIDANHTTDWVDLVTGPGMQMSQNLSISGGSEKRTYRFSGGFLNEDGNVLYTGFKRYNL
ncbi:MAG TPA: carboxypeptidase-like regulatory domain-containing protein, partial [Haliscomenobacter sp.]|uniref:carboxypeptidase-like regulatory domain-containing protein n=1 Tax=Haliscomenobacter sp. TaxID=2717303 RepID=UPI002C1EF9C8